MFGASVFLPELEARSDPAGPALPVGPTSADETPARGAPPSRTGAAPAWIGVPPPLVYTDGDPVPAGYHLERRKKLALVVNGAILAGTAYVGGLFLGFIRDLPDNATGKMFLPAVGPWVVLLSGGANTCKMSFETSSDLCSPKETKIVLAIDGLLQAAGIVGFIVGLRGERVLRRDRVPAMVVAPTTLRGGAHGAMLVARF